MSKFDNKLCPVCRIPLNENSDIVVCPICGTPHHRACYLKQNRCGAEGFHDSGFVWNGRLPDEEPPEPPENEQPETAEQAAQQDAGQQSTDTAANDPHHAEYPGGTPGGSTGGTGSAGGMGGMGDRGGMNGYINLDDLMNQMRSRTMDETRGEDGVSSRELSCFVGKSVMHYSQAFAMFRAPLVPGQKRRYVFFNFCSGLFAPVHQFYRKMDLMGLALLAIELIYYIPTVLYTIGIGSLDVLRNIQMAASGLNFVAMIAMCIFGDYIYYRHCVKKIKKIRMNFDDGRAEGYYEALAESGSPSWLRAIIGILVVYFAEACVMLLLNRFGQQ